MKLIEIGIYADQTGLFSESELNRDNWCEIYIPENFHLGFINFKSFIQMFDVYN